MNDENFLSRWSRLKRSGGAPAEPAVPPPAPVAAAVPSTIEAQPQAPAPLPPVDSLEPGADIAAFMRAGVEQGLKRAALKKLLQDPRFNVMDGLDVYIDDYSKPDPLPAGWLEKMNQSLRLGEYREPEAVPGEAAAESTVVPAPQPERDAELVEGQETSPEPPAQAAAEGDQPQREAQDRA